MPLIIWFFIGCVPFCCRLYQNQIGNVITKINLQYNYITEYFTYQEESDRYEKICYIIYFANTVADIMRFAREVHTDSR